MGLYDYRSRYYDPELGRFISENPLRFAGGDLNLYTYAGGDPVTYSEPFGVERWSRPFPLSPDSSHPISTWLRWKDRLFSDRAMEWSTPSCRGLCEVERWSRPSARQVTAIGLTVRDVLLAHSGVSTRAKDGWAALGDVPGGPGGVLGRADERTWTPREWWPFVLEPR